MQNKIQEIIKRIKDEDIKMGAIPRKCGFRIIFPAEKSAARRIEA